MADWDADNFELEEPIKKAAAATAAVAVLDKWEGEDEEEDVKDNWDDDEEEKKVEVKKTETKVSEKKRLSEKIKEKENQLKKKQEEMREKEEELTPEEQQAEKLRVKKLQEDADLELAKDAFGISSSTPTTNNVTGIDAMCPSSKDDFTEFEKLLKEKICQFEKSVHYSNFLDSLFRELCISLEVEDLKKVSNSLTVLLSEKQKQEKQNKGKKKKKTGVLAGGGLKAKMRDDLDYAEFDGGYAQDYEDFM
ncbi:eukaryotic translation initiation factor 3 subunit J-B [Centroberyx gerrardi]|uniref:eukaryotic translation initiation factor 3 subunit J-B n=1 Tax=Centroberyx gerrardi TaxID=166262 RepID=UPI003AAFAB08